MAAVPCRTMSDVSATTMCNMSSGLLIYSGAKLIDSCHYWNPTKWVFNACVLPIKSEWLGVTVHSTQKIIDSKVGNQYAQER